MASEQERIAHVVRRLGMGGNASVIDQSATVEESIAAALDLSDPVPAPPVYDPPLEQEDVNDYRAAIPFGAVVDRPDGLRTAPDRGADDLVLA